MSLPSCLRWTPSLKTVKGVSPSGRRSYSWEKDFSCWSSSSFGCTGGQSININEINEEKKQTKIYLLSVCIKCLQDCQAKLWLVRESPKLPFFVKWSCISFVVRILMSQPVADIWSLGPWGHFIFPLHCNSLQILANQANSGESGKSNSKLN